MKKDPYELVFGQPPHSSIFPGTCTKDIMEEDVEEREEEKSGKESLATSSEHMALRKATDEQYRNNSKRLHLKYTKEKRKKVLLTFSPGDFGSLHIPRIGRSSTDAHRLPCIIVECLGSKFYLYRLRCAHGVLKQCYGWGGRPGGL